MQTDRNSAPEARQHDHDLSDDGLVGLLCDIWEAALGLPRVGPDDDFFELGGDSLEAVNLAAEVHRRFGRKVPFALVASHPSPAAFARALRAKVDLRSGDRLILLRASTAAPGHIPPLFLIPGAGGNVFGYHRLTRHLITDRPIYGIPLPVTTETTPETAPLRVEDLAERFVVRVRAVQPRGPYHLGGYSFGGRIAFEMARQLADSGQAVGFLAMFDTFGQGFPPPLSRARRLARHARRFVGQKGWRARGVYLWDRLARFRASARRLQERLWNPRDYPVPETIREDFSQHFAASQEYIPKPYDGRVILFRARDRFDFEWCDYSDATLGWGQVARGGVEIHDVPGCHLSLFNEPNVAELSGILSACLEPAARRLHRA